MKPMTSECADQRIKQQIPNSKSKILVEPPLNDDCPNYTSSLTVYKPERKADNLMNLQAFQYEANTATLMPNTSEFKELRSSEESSQKLEIPQKCPVSTSSEPKSLKCRNRHWRILLGVLWTLCFTTVMILIALHNIAKNSNVTEKQETVLETFEHTNYQICLLIARNCRRLIVSSIPFINSNVK